MRYSKKEDDRMFEEYSKYKIKCKHCGHSTTMPIFLDKKICSWCGNYIFRTKEIEFKHKLNQAINKEKRLCYDNTKTNKISK